MTAIDYRGLEAERSLIARKGTDNLRKLGTLGLVVCGGLALGTVFYRDWAGHQVDLLAKDKNEVFSVPPAPIANFGEPGLKTGDRSNSVKMVPPSDITASIPAVAAAPVPVAALASPDSDLEARLKLLEDQRRLDAERIERERLAAIERARQERLRSAQVILDTEDAPGRAAAAADGVAAPVKIDVETDANRAFLNAASNRDVEVSRASRLPRTDALVAQGTMIHGSLDVALNSDLPGFVRATTTDDTWSLDGRRILIPRGSRLIGEYRSGLARGQTRVFIVWTRMIDADNKTSVQLGSTGTDDLGLAGLGGEVDHHFVERFGASILLSIVGGGAQFISGLGQNSNQVQTQTQSVDPLTGRVTTTTAQPGNQQQQQARQIGAQQVSQSLTTIAQESLKDSINIPPTIIVNQGERIEIFVRRDLDFSGLYPDPVKQEVRRLRQGGTLRADVDPTPLPLPYSPSFAGSDEPKIIRAPAIVRKP